MHFLCFLLDRLQRGDYVGDLVEQCMVHFFVMIHLYHLTQNYGAE
jgi:hypothetical protein